MKKVSLLLLPFLFAACQSTQTPPPAEPVVQDGPSISEIQAAAASSEAAMMATKQYINFLGKSTLVDHPGTFESFEVTVNQTGTSSMLDTATISVVINVDSITSDSNGLTEHLKKEDFFDAVQFPTITFTSTDIVATETGYNITGDLTAKGKTVSIEGTGTVQNGMLAVEFLVPRAELSIGNDSYGEKLLADEIPVSAQISLETAVQN